jgi:adenosylmethionine-8-amino-7-oxononanoate aminotransferase
VTTPGIERLMLNFTYNDEDWHRFPEIVSGKGCYVTDVDGKRYLDGLGALYTTEVGHGRAELAKAAADQMERLAFFPTWSLEQSRSLELAARLDELAPGSGHWSAFFTTSGSEAIEAMLKLVRQYHGAKGDPMRFKFISRNVAYHGVTAGALALTGIPVIQAPFEPMPGGFIHVPNTHDDPEGAADAIARAIELGPPETIAAVVLEPVQNGGGCYVPPPGYWQRVREICDRYGVLLVADSTICAFGRIGTWFGVERFDVVPDVITFAKGLTSGYLPMGGLLISEKVREALDSQAMFLHGSTFGGHATTAAVALENLSIIEREGLLQHVRENEEAFGSILRDLASRHPMVGEVRGMGFFWAFDIDPTWADGRPLEGEDYLQKLKLGLHHRLIELGMICRVDDRDSPVLQFSPPLIADVSVMEEIATISDQAMAELERDLGYS